MPQGPLDALPQPAPSAAWRCKGLDCQQFPPSGTLLNQAAWQCGMPRYVLWDAKQEIACKCITIHMCHSHSCFHFLGSLVQRQALRLASRGIGGQKLYD